MFVPREGPVAEGYFEEGKVAGRMSPTQPGIWLPLISSPALSCCSTHSSPIGLYTVSWPPQTLGQDFAPVAIFYRIIHPNSHMAHSLLPSFRSSFECQKSFSLTIPTSNSALPIPFSWFSFPHNIYHHLTGSWNVCPAKVEICVCFAHCQISCS